MKFYELEEGKEYKGGEQKYKKMNDCLCFYSTFSEQWVPTTLDLYAAYKLDFEEIKNESQKQFEELSKGVTITDYYDSNDLTVELNYSTFDSFVDFCGDEVLFIQINDEHMSLTIDEFDLVANYVNKVKQLIEEVRK